ncbi:methyltransferase domain-containing protein, partial [Porphyromonas levii]
LEDSQCYPETLLDVGAGTGAVAWAVDEKLDLKNIVCLERESAMRKTGKALMQNGSQVLRNAKWISHDLTIDEIPEKADLVVASYVLNEMSPEDRIKAAKKLWNATNKMLLIIEPGTPVGFSNLKKIR